MNLTEIKSQIADKTNELKLLQDAFEMICYAYENNKIILYKHRGGDIYMRITDIKEIEFDSTNPDNSRVIFNYRSVSINPPFFDSLTVLPKISEGRLYIYDLMNMTLVDDDNQVKDMLRGEFNKLIDQI